MWRVDGDYFSRSVDGGTWGTSEGHVNNNVQAISKELNVADVPSVRGHVCRPKKTRVGHVQSEASMSLVLQGE